MLSNPQKFISNRTAYRIVNVKRILFIIQDRHEDSLSGQSGHLVLHALH